MKRMAIAELSGKTMTTATALVQLMRLQQITCGHFKADDGTVKQIKNNRVNELLEVLNEVEGKAIIWCHWRHDIQSVVKAIEKEYGPRSLVTYYGDTTTEDRQDAIKQIQNPDSEVRFLVGTPQTGGYGITLTEANTMIYFSNGYDLEKRTQSEARIDRIGQTRNMTYVDIIAENTVDEKIVKALRKKIDIASQIMGEELKDWI
jgi:SNF2 family DNA or RNA helicase